MTRLRKALFEIQRADTHAGGSLSEQARMSLGTLQRSLALQGWLIFIAVFVGVALAVWGAIVNIQNPQSLAVFSGALGLSVAAALELLRRTWRELGQTNLLLILLNDIGEKQIATLVDKLIENLPA